ncbi:hypothetical protein C8Q76DRAFT_737903 [Earliella scabrosa]|nr:hypothetical protein C8Q76DRAFT_737903 [Earliella scabrosa]
MGYVPFLLDSHANITTHMELDLDPDEKKLLEILDRIFVRISTSSSRAFGNAGRTQSKASSLQSDYFRHHSDARPSTIEDLTGGAPEMSATSAKLGIRKQPVCFGTRLAQVLVLACTYAIAYRASIHRHPQYRLCLPLAFPRYNRSTSLRRRGPSSSAPFFLALICCLSVFTVVSLDQAEKSIPRQGIRRTLGDYPQTVQDSSQLISSMVDWEDPEVVTYVFFLYEQITIFMLGFYGTQFINSLNVEWELLTGKRAFRLVHAPYLLARYITLSALLFFVISGRIQSRIACDFAYRLFASLGSLAAMLASLILGSRPAAIFWTLKTSAPLFLLGALAFGQGFLVTYQGIATIRAMWDEGTAMCVVYKWDSTVLAIFYIYTFAYDVVILLLTLYAVRRVHHEQKRRRWGVGDILCIQGIGYVVVTCIVNMPVAVLAVLDLNAGMDVLLSIPAMTISVIASSLTLLTLEDFSASCKCVPRTSSRSAGGEQDRTGTGAPRASERASSTQYYASVTTHIPMTLSAIDSEEVFDDDLAALAAAAAKTESRCVQLPSPSESQNGSVAGAGKTQDGGAHTDADLQSV